MNSHRGNFKDIPISIGRLFGALLMLVVALGLLTPLNGARAYAAADAALDSVEADADAEAAEDTALDSVEADADVEAAADEVLDFMEAEAAKAAEDVCADNRCAPGRNNPDKAADKQGIESQGDQKLYIKENGLGSIASTFLPSGPVVEQDYAPNPAVWKLADADTTIYLFGTFHVLPRGFRWRSEGLEKILAEVDELVVETSDDDISNSKTGFGDIITEYMADENMKTVSQRLSDTNRPKWRRIAEESGIPFDTFDRMPVFFALTSAGMSISRGQGSQSQYGVETVLESEFNRAERPIGSIEDAGTVLRNLLDLDERALIEDLDIELSAWDGDDVSLFLENTDIAGSTDIEGEVSEPFAMEHAWAQGVLEEVNSDMFGATDAGQALYQVLLVDRNRAWAGWLNERLDQPGTILLAVGAAHLEGQDSVQEMLKKRGLTVERIH